MSSSIPAWKRLGLKLKAAADTQAPDSSAPSQTGTTTSTAPAATSQDAASKRKSSGLPAPDHPSKKPRREDTNNARSKPKAKSVSFAAETEELAPPTTNGQKIPKRQKQKQDRPAAVQTPKGTQPNNNGAAKPLAKKQNAVANLQSAIEYLRQWHSARDAWKFNKNHQTRLLEYVFSDETTIPAVDINVFYEYIRPLKGFVRKRLRETAAEVKSTDMDKGSEAFSASSNKDVAARKQKEYEEVIASYLEQEPAPGKRRFEEMDYVLRTADMEMQRRVVKRMRAEMVLDELPDVDEPESSASTATPTETETAGEGSAEGQQPAANNEEGDKRIKLNDGTQRRLRRNKVRTVDVEDDSSSSSEDESDSESETSSSGSDSSSDKDSDSENAMDVDPARNEDETSSSSSSSSSESDSDSDDESSDDEA
ncbi:hypothetical protein LQW54_000739 [Pestalotiopsis sp. IQ-011]